MRKVVLKIFGFTAFLILINWGIKEITWNKYNRVYENVNLDANVFLLGDSHIDAIGEFNNSDISNLGFPNDSYFEIFTKLKYIQNNGHPKIIILSADEHMINSCRDYRYNDERVTYYKTINDYSNINDFIENRYIRYYISFFNPRHKQLLSWYFKHGDYSFFNLRKYIDDGSLNDFPEDSIKYKIQKRFLDYFNKKSNSLPAELLKILNYCKENNIIVIGLKPPLYRDYNKKIKENWNSSIDSIFGKQGISILNYQDFNSADKSLFSDCDHLNPKGSKIFRDIMNEEILKIDGRHKNRDVL